ncbi:MAG: VOC family protein [Pseudomonadota bacterium]
MRFHHMAVFVSDMEQAITLWRDVLGFRVIYDAEIPDGKEPGLSVYMTPQLLDDIFGVKDARSRMVLVISDQQAIIELQQCLNPQIEATPKEHLRYRHTGIHELGLNVDDIDYWFKRIKESGYETQTDYVWPCAGIGRSFLFYDDDGNMIQLWQDVDATTATNGSV